MVRDDAQASRGIYMEEVIEQLRRALPPIFLGSATDDLTGGAICWGTVQNKRCRGEIANTPPDWIIHSIFPLLLFQRALAPQQEFQASPVEDFRLFQLRPVAHALNL